MSKKVLHTLTAAEIKWLDEIDLDLHAAERTLEIALNFHSNQINRIEKEKRKLWDHLIEAAGLPSCEYQIKNIDGEMCVVRKEDE